MMGKRGAWYLEPPLDFVDAITLWPRADQQPEDLEAVLLPKGAELFHAASYDVSSIIEIMKMQHRDLFCGSRRARQSGNGEPEVSESRFTAGAALPLARPRLALQEATAVPVLLAIVI